MATPQTPTALTAVRACRAQTESAELAMVHSLLDWAVEHELEVDTTGTTPWGDTRLTLAGPGAPAVSEFALYELATALGRSIRSTTTRVGLVLEVRYRLPLLWARVAAGEVSPWRAFRIAEKTLVLDQAGASYADRMLAPFAGTLSIAQLDRTVTDALASYAPALAAARVAAAAESRGVQIDLDPRVTGLEALAGVVEVHAVLDTVDALDLDHAIRHTAGQLADLGSTETLGVRRALALGEIARAQLTLDLGGGSPDGTAPTGRGITLNVHLRPDTHVGELDLPGLTSSVWITQVKDWCRTAGTTIKVLPVVDLNTESSTGAYTPTTPIRRHVELRDRHCVAPYCHRPARACDLDHIDPYDTGGATSTTNLAPLCRRHHRLKTHHPGWTYTMTGLGRYRWTTPSGMTFDVDSHGTRDTGPPGPD